jgi:hypothetical protein
MTWLRNEDGTYIELIDPDWDYGDVRDRIASTTAEERSKAAFRYMEARYRDATSHYTPGPSSNLGPVDPPEDCTTMSAEGHIYKRISLELLSQYPGVMFLRLEPVSGPVIMIEVKPDDLNSIGRLIAYEGQKDASSRFRNIT